MLMAAGINAITRKTRGDDIDAACGQLVGQVKDRTRRSERHKLKHRKINLPLNSDSARATLTTV